MARAERKSGLNIDFSSMIIGFLLAACLALAVGASSGGSEGPYQISATSDISAYVIDTRTGECWQISRGDNVELGTPLNRKSRRTSITPYTN